MIAQAKIKKKKDHHSSALFPYSRLLQLCNHLARVKIILVKFRSAGSWACYQLFWCLYFTTESLPRIRFTSGLYLSHDLWRRGSEWGLLMWCLELEWSPYRLLWQTHWDIHAANMKRPIRELFPMSRWFQDQGDVTSPPHFLLEYFQNDDIVWIWRKLLEECWKQMPNAVNSNILGARRCVSWSDEINLSKGKQNLTTDVPDAFSE